MTTHCSESPIFISVAICSHRRADRLDAALASLERQSYLGADVEVLIIENDSDSTPEVKSVFEKHRASLNLKHVLESSIGLSHARNTALRVARGSYVAYLDDDSEADCDWLAALVQECRTTEPAFCGGPIYPLYRSAKPGWFLDRYATAYLYGEFPRWLCKGEWFSGSNFTVDRRLCLQLGGFRTDLGMTGKTIAYGEETELLMRAWNCNPNLRIRYAPQVSIHHEVRPEKMFLRWRFKAAWAGGGSGALMTPLSLREAVRETLRSMIDLPKQLLSVPAFLRREGEKAQLWRQWAYEVFYLWLWVFSRNWHALLSGKR